MKKRKQIIGSKPHRCRNTSPKSNHYFMFHQDARASLEQAVNEAYQELFENNPFGAVVLLEGVPRFSKRGRGIDSGQVVQELIRAEFLRAVAKAYLRILGRSTDDASILKFMSQNVDSDPVLTSRPRRKFINP